ncbi:hypothetical protein H696_04994 [Fonticula alba]|uniref:tRNA-specific adenosine deaminase 1 n=1 Tax=Fonticula alba TaxID=691883 RepID=A0A058Z3J0_FONAL|nr:hypothetical protein H696_04994 [Fonticula alba]KCV68706.1 hypothetical protein H696_04994 [Fonticula alba]|eukprot:XP_009497138.1 hypothetical protein H696_04994 [Fonticula alba]
MSEDAGLSDQVSRLCVEAFDRLPRKGRPAADQWTVLAGFVLEDTAIKAKVPAMRVIALGSGTRALPRHLLPDGPPGLGTSSLAPGDLVLDMHAEVMARRSLVRFLLLELCHALGAPNPQAPDTPAPFDQPILLRALKPDAQVSPFRWNARYRLHFYVSQAPCGDCCVFPMAQGAEQLAIDSDLIHFTDRRSDGPEPAPANKRRRLEPEASGARDPAQPADPGGQTNKTGSKALPGAGDQDQFGEGVHVLQPGILRTKPGRGPPTHTMSCSDKVAKWVALGPQGALLAAVLERPVPIASIHIGEIFDDAAANRALIGRVGALRAGSHPTVHPAPMIFEHSLAAVTRASQPGTTVRKSEAAIGWNSHEPSVVCAIAQGVNLGASLKKHPASKLRCSLSKVSLFALGAVILSHPSMESALPAAGRDLFRPLRTLWLAPVSPAEGLMHVPPTVGQAAGMAAKMPPTRTAPGIRYADAKRLSAWYADRRRALLSGPFLEWLGNGGARLPSSPATVPPPRDLLSSVRLYARREPDDASVQDDFLLHWPADKAGP